MSERGSFVTEFIYCSDCLEKMRKVLCLPVYDKYLIGYQLDKLPIIAGKIGGTYFGEEFVKIECELFNEDNAPCHSIRMAVLSDSNGSAIFNILPSGEVERVGDNI